MKRLAILGTIALTIVMNGVTSFGITNDISIGKGVDDVSYAKTMIGYQLKETPLQVMNCNFDYKSKEEIVVVDGEEIVVEHIIDGEKDLSKYCLVIDMKVKENQTQDDAINEALVIMDIVKQHPSVQSICVRFMKENDIVYGVYAK